MPESWTGGCRCGGVRYSIEGRPRDVMICHCSDCRRITGNYMAAVAALVDEFSLVSHDTLRWFRSQPRVEYGFCATCGATLFWRAEDKSSSISIAAGTLDSTVGLQTIGVLFDAERAEYLPPHPGVDALPGDRQGKA